MNRLVQYFENYGPENTPDVIGAVADRLGEGDISAIVVASTSGRTALEFARQIGSSGPRLVCVSDPPQASSYPGIGPDDRDALEKLGVVIVDRVPYASVSYLQVGSEEMHGGPDLRAVIFDAFRVVGGNGLKVAIEVGLMAADGGIIQPGERIISAGGTETGADTAIVMKAAFSSNLLAKNPADRPEVREILAMPLAKKWW